MTGDCGLHKTKKVQYSSYDSGPRSNLATSLLCTQRKPLVIEKKPAAYFSKKIAYQSTFNKSSNSLGKPFYHFDIFLRDTIKRYCFPQSLATNYNCRFVQGSVSQTTIVYTVLLVWVIH